MRRAPLYTSRHFGSCSKVLTTSKHHPRTSAEGRRFRTAMESDYASWSNSDLIKRVSELEAQLRAQNIKHAAPLSSHASPAPPKKKPKKAAKAFDPDRYHTRLIALKFAYLGGNYNGFEHHANNTTPLPTIEEELWKALTKVKLIFPKHKSGQSEEDVCWDGIEYSKCGRTDRGVSAFGQVIGLKVRSAQPKRSPKAAAASAPNEVGAGAKAEDAGGDSPMPDASDEAAPVKEFDPIRDELPYIQLINRVLPPDIRVLAWCPDPPQDFSARFNCKERRYRYFFTNPAYTPLPGSQPIQEGRPGEGWLDVDAMAKAASKYQGLHDFRNFCKVDPSKQISNFERRIFHAGIHEVQSSHLSNQGSHSLSPKLYYLEVRGSAFLWHQVRHLVAVLFLVGQGLEQPSVIDDLLDTQKTPGKPHYEMASDVPLVLWDCIFPSAEKIANADHADVSATSDNGYYDELNWIYVGDEVGGREQTKRQTTGIEDGKHGRNGIMDDLWALWRKRKMDEVLAWSLMEVVSAQGKLLVQNGDMAGEVAERSARVFDGSAVPRAVGTYIPLARRECLETPDVVNAQYAARKGIVGRPAPDIGADE